MLVHLLQCKAIGKLSLLSCEHLLDVVFADTVYLGRVWPVQEGWQEDVFCRDAVLFVVALVLLYLVRLEAPRAVLADVVID